MGRKILICLIREYPAIRGQIPLLRLFSDLPETSRSIVTRCFNTGYDILRRSVDQSLNSTNCLLPSADRSLSSVDDLLYSVEELLKAVADLLNPVEQS